MPQYRIHARAQDGKTGWLTIEAADEGKAALQAERAGYTELKFGRPEAAFEADEPIGKSRRAEQQAQIRNVRWTWQYGVTPPRGMYVTGSGLRPASEARWRDLLDAEGGRPVLRVSDGTSISRVAIGVLLGMTMFTLLSPAIVVLALVAWGSLGIGAGSLLGQ